LAEYQQADYGTNDAHGGGKPIFPDSPLPNENNDEEGGQHEIKAFGIETNKRSRKAAQR
jgi:hypothetical protein